MSLLFIDLFGETAPEISRFVEDVRRLTEDEVTRMMTVWLGIENDEFLKAINRLSNKRVYGSGGDQRFDLTYGKSVAIETVVGMAAKEAKQRFDRYSISFEWVMVHVGLAMASYRMFDEEYTRADYDTIMRVWEARKETGDVAE